MDARQNDYMKTIPAAEYSGVKPQTLANYRSTGDGPVFIKIGKTCFYSKQKLDEWMKSLEVTEAVMLERQKRAKAKQALRYVAKKEAKAKRQAEEAAKLSEAA